MKAKGPDDAAARGRALALEASFIVQAPAGSGKTGLLIQRYLALLAIVDVPEEVIAITFTRKAAGEMRDRVMLALALADGPVPEDEYQRTTYDLARRVLARDRELGWAVALHPARLRIQTFDALCSSFTRRLPWSSRFGGIPSITEDADGLYLEAARETIRLVQENNAWGGAVASLLQHLDNDVAKLSGLLARMLARRDQWLPRLAGRDSRDKTLRRELEEALERAVCGALEILRSSVPARSAAEIVVLGRYAGDNLAGSDPDAPAAQLAGLEALPGAHIVDLPLWQGIAALLLTSEGRWRTRFTVKQGFPPDKTPLGLEMKRRAAALRASLSREEYLRELLAAGCDLPAPHYTDSQWQALRALVQVLPLAAAQLRLIFAGRGEVDFIEMAQAGQQALGAEGEPTNLALALDYRIRHLLVDEFQDTSYSQFGLLQQLTAGWSPDDGRTLFAVGDPMQSIYRFRDAEVGLYLHAQHHGIGDIPLEPLRLTTNFRSRAGIVDWINASFPGVLPREEDITTCAVPYSPCAAYHGHGPGDAVRVQRVDNDSDEARRVVALVREARKEDPQGSIAILVRARTHLRKILPALRAAGIRFRAVDLEPLGSRPVVQDLMALTRALLHPADRIAWLAVLRAPWCGLELADLQLLTGLEPHAILLDRMREPQRRSGMSEPGRRRLESLLGTLEQALERRRRQPLRRWVEGVWLALGGPACIDDTDLEDARMFLDLLESLEYAGDLPDPERLLARVDELTALPDVHEDSRLQIMSMHKAKGLEFDTVILPGLARSPRSPDAPLLAWSHRAAGPGVADVLFAPVHASGDPPDPVYQYLCQVERGKHQYEAGRLLYVAATRARQRLHLIVQVDSDREGNPRPPKRGSLLALLWPALQSEMGTGAQTPGESPASAGSGVSGPGLRRLPDGWVSPVPEQALDWEYGKIGAEQGPHDCIEFEWAGETARHIGTVVHRHLRRLAEQGAGGGAADQLAALEPLFRAELSGLGLAGEELVRAVLRVVRILQSALENPRGCWILDPTHQEARNEYAVSGLIDGRIVNVVMDRTFVADGIRWIVDYKTGYHAGAGREEYLDQEVERYRVQLESYAGLMQAMDDHPIRLGLYFPQMQAWREWPYDR